MVEVKKYLIENFDEIKTNKTYCTYFQVHTYTHMGLVIFETDE